MACLFEPKTISGDIGKKYYYGQREKKHQKQVVIRKCEIISTKACSSGICKMVSRKHIMQKKFQKMTLVEKVKF